MDYSTAGDLNMGANIRDMLAIHAENGKDYFVSVTGNFREQPLPCCCIPLSSDEA